MDEMRIEELSDTEFDVLKEVSNIGTGNAATAISKLLGGRVDIKVPDIRFLQFDELSEIIGGAENEVIGILVSLENDIDGMMMFVMDKPSASVIVNGILNRGDEELGAEMTEMEISVLTEFGNIIAGSYLSAISGLTGMVVSPSVPALSDDMAGAILSVPAIEFGKMSDRVLLIQSEFCSEFGQAKGFFILVPTLRGFDNIFKKLGLKKE
ncbi:MAG: chemotaxis protein CheC [Lachnospiraceae bacterium]|nr:chemotaxis protein CheC [Lachnospiraceae bacterium]MBR4145598.1 chemotaxis protein CheC [Lachnospiraceae bacterium]MBR4781815.1 chemotaxis protein CheC [Lachnospiraceae bacterium]MBR6473876.1 chemotaxis protein CheC [Lachnospiraceae bacterium]